MRIVSSSNQTGAMATAPEWQTQDWRQVPEAAIKLRQGFGRLIRSRTDTGQVVILDPRIKTKRYGKLFLDSLPDCRIEYTG
jgi:Rad3-related DNA helicase